MSFYNVPAWLSAFESTTEQAAFDEYYYHVPEPFSTGFEPIAPMEYMHPPMYDYESFPGTLFTLPVMTSSELFHEEDEVQQPDYSYEVDYTPNNLAGDSRAAPVSSSGNFDRDGLGFDMNMVYGGSRSVASSSKEPFRRSNGKATTQDEKVRDVEVNGRTCPICLDTVSPYSLITVNDCFHSVCAPCMLQYIATAARERRWPVPCMECRQDIPPELCLQTLSGMSPEYEIMERLVLERCFHGDGIKYCANRECRAPFELLQSTDDLRYDQTSDVVSCPLCYCETCVKCDRSAHEHLTCDQAAGLSPSAQADLQLANLAERSGWRKCPKCKTYTEKEEGCNYCVCICGATFCYKCGRPYKNRLKYGRNANVHGVPNCSCGLFS